MAYAHGRQTKLYLDEFDISGRSFTANIAGSQDPAETTGMGGTTDRTYISGITGPVTAAISSFFYSGSGDVEDILTDYYEGNETGLLTICQRGVVDDAACYHLRDANCKGLEVVSRLAAAVAMNSEWEADDGCDRMLVVYEASPTGSENGSGVDFLGAGPAGSGVAVLHCTSVTGSGTIDVKLQESSDNGSGDAWADISGAAFTQVAAIGSERITWSGATEQYVRAVITISGFSAATIFVAARTDGETA
jgi:hypothetical protein